MANKKTYNEEFKEKIMNEVKECGNVTKVADAYELPRSTIYDWMKSKEDLKSLNKENELIKEHNKLKIIIAEMELEKRMLNSNIVSNYNKIDILKIILGEKELEIRELKNKLDKIKEKQQ